MFLLQPKDPKAVFRSAREAGKTVMRGIFYLMLGAILIALTTMDINNPVHLWVRSIANYIVAGIPLAVWALTIAREMNMPHRDHSLGNLLSAGITVTVINIILVIVERVADFENLFALLGLVIQMFVLLEMVVYCSFVAVDKRRPPISAMVFVAVTLGIVVFQILLIG